MDYVLVKKSNYTEFNPEYLDIIIKDDNISVLLYKATTSKNLEGYIDSDYELKSRRDFKVSDIDIAMNTFCIYPNVMEELSEPINNTKYVSNSREGYSILNSVYHVFTHNAMLLMIRNDEKFVFLAQGIPVRNTNITNIMERFYKEMASDALKEVFGDSYSSNATNAVYKRKNVLLELSPNESLSYLEAQIDILTKIVFSLLKIVDPTIKEEIKADGLEDLDSIEDALMNHSLLNVKDVEKCLGEINKTKAKVRKIQEDYYSFKQGN